jgi:hypothetical protein
LSEIIAQKSWSKRRDIIILNNYLLKDDFEVKVLGKQKQYLGSNAYIDNRLLNSLIGENK